MRTSEIAVLAIVLISFISAIYIYPQVPDIIPSHWNASGEVDGYAPKSFGLFIMPAVSLMIFLLFTAIPRIDPLKKNIAQFRKYFDRFIVIISLFFFYLYLLTVFWSFGLTFNIIPFMIPAFSVLIYYSGVLIEKSKRNWFIGIRTPWTMSSDEVWNKTSRVTGKLFKIVAVVSLAGIVLGDYAFALLLTPLFAVVIYSVVYSYQLYKKKSRK